LFIDDREENISAARKFGFLGILFKDVEQLRRDLKKQGLSTILPAL
jgi:hypothetical protein